MTYQQRSKAVRRQMLKDAGWYTLTGPRKDEWYVPEPRQRAVVSGPATRTPLPKRMYSFGAAWAAYCEATGRSRRLSKTELGNYTADDIED